MNFTHSKLGIPLFALAVVFAVAGGGCNVGNEGERCNPDLSHNECNAGLSCQQPKDCPENYCCPTSGTSSNPYCQPGCAGGQASICAAGGDADCWELEGGEGGEDGGTSGDAGADAAADAGPG